jgi:hypothetical protein
VSLVFGTKLGPYEILAPLSHPNILAIFDFGRQGDTAYAVMELLEGETLRARLAQGALPSRKAVELAAQIAEGLAAAHEKGIVHRDLKPENVFVTREGRAKVLDFGLAKRTDSASGPGISMQVTAAHTGPGTVLGTAAYMSPEQVRREAVDHRSDIFSFGAVLYEMLTGRQAFGRQTATESMTAILREDPPEIAAAGSSVSPALQRIVQRCVEKKPGERFQSARDLAFALQALSGSAVVSGSAVAVTRTRSRPWLAAMAVMALLGVGTVAAGIVMGWRPQPEPPAWQALTFRRGGISRARFAPDGQTVVYAAGWEGRPQQLFSTRLDSTESTPLSLPTATVAGISHGGKMAIFLLENPPVLAEVPLAGGSPRELLADFLGADWVPGEEKLAVLRKNRLEFPIGKVLYEPTAGRRVSDGSLRASPSGDAFALIENDTDVVLVSRAGKPTTLSGGWWFAWFPAWNPKTDEIWFSAREAGRFGGFLELHAVTRAGKHRVVARGPSHLVPMDILPDGRVLLASLLWPTSMMCLPPGSAHEVNLSWLDFSAASDLSADGKWILFDETAAGGGSKGLVYLRGTDGSGAKRLGEGLAVALSPDGRWAISAPSFPPADRLVFLPTGTGEEKELRLQGMVFTDARWFPDSKRILVSAGSRGRPARLFVEDLEGGPARPLTPEGFEVGPVSPDGRSAAVRDAKGNLILWPIDGGEPRPLQGTTPKDRAIQWTGPTGLFLATGNLPVRIDRYDIPTGKRQLWKELAPADTTGVSSLSAYLQREIIAPDGKSYAYSFRRDLSQLFLVTGLQ